jgi:hypothetical protein
MNAGAAGGAALAGLASARPTLAFAVAAAAAAAALLSAALTARGPAPNPSRAGETAAA